MYNDTFIDVIVKVIQTTKDYKNWWFNKELTKTLN